MFGSIVQKIREFRKRKGMILMYHQICDRTNDPWELAVNPNHFHEQLTYLKRNFKVVSIAELASNLRRNHLGNNTVAITFDDGFKDTCFNAAPLLDYYEMPATFYVATTALQDQKVYWWDTLQEIVLQAERLPAELEIVISGETVRFQFRRDRVLDKKLINKIRAWNHTLPICNERIALYMLLWKKLKPLGWQEQLSILNELKHWAGYFDATGSQGITMDVQEMQMLSQNPLFTIGAHSVHHSLLSGQRAEDQMYEVKESKRQIEQWLGGRKINGFAYPYGNYNEVTQNILKEAGYEYAVSAESKLVTPEDDPYALPRIQVKNWCVYEFASRLNEIVN